MHVFVTGATGFIGSAVVPELLRAGHSVTGLARSDAGAAALEAAGVQAHRGDLEDLDGLRAGAAAADAVVHLAYIHDFSRFAENARVDERAIAALGEGLEGTGRPLAIASGTLMVAAGGVATEEDSFPEGGTAGPRLAGVRTALALRDRGVRVSIVRLPPTVHGAGDKGFIPATIAVAREKGVAAYIGDGANRWPSVHRLDAARVFALALERPDAGPFLHAVADEGVPLRQIAELTARHLGVPTRSIAPEQAAEHFGWLGGVLAVDNPASSALTRRWLGWEPAQPGLIDDLEAGHYFAG